MCVEIVNFYEDGPKFNAPTHIAYGHLDKPVGPQCLQWVCNKLQFLKNIDLTQLQRSAVITRHIFYKSHKLTTT